MPITQLPDHQFTGHPNTGPAIVALHGRDRDTMTVALECRVCDTDLEAHIINPAEPVSTPVRQLLGHVGHHLQLKLTPAPLVVCHTCSGTLVRAA